MNDDTATRPSAPAAERAAERRVSVLRRVFPPPVGPGVDDRFLHGQRVVIGRSPGAGGWKVDDAECSRRHAELAFDARLECHRIRDLGSRNGTWVDGRRVEQRGLQSGSVVRLGGSLFVYVHHDFPADAAPDRLTADVALAREAVHRRLDVLAGTRLPLLVKGPSGAGKERLAARVHTRSGRVGDLVVVNCAAMSPELATSALFGHLRGAYTGASVARKGHLLSADGGTLFLDEIGDLPLDLQPLLLRAVQEGRVRPVGSDREMAVDLRLVAASHQDLAEKVGAGTFRRDLFERLRGATIELPPLSARRDEILALVRAFTDGHGLTVDAAERLLIHDWPGNVRELRHVAEEAQAFAPPGGPIDLPHLPARVRAVEPVAEAPGKPTRDRLVSLLTTHGGRVNRVAEALGVQRTQIYRWVKAAGIDLDDFRG